MDSNLVKELQDYLILQKFPDGSGKKERYIIKRRASNFLIKVNIPIPFQTVFISDMLVHGQQKGVKS